MICEQRICLSSAGNAELITERSLVQIQPAQRAKVLVVGVEAALETREPSPFVSKFGAVLFA